ncbi:uncharacterized protein DEA37_0014637 [Paragonimus westermani]|uniref:Uncharacterized protein n=1 Tax=Paragonimus westermani TaxID=34504 RepID=A0A5J4NSA2_9TREM|nr:uncharacterized protein DEA37_0014637 [Paragonimus westermani]
MRDKAVFTVFLVHLLSYHGVLSMNELGNPGLDTVYQNTAGQELNTAPISFLPDGVCARTKPSVKAQWVVDGFDTVHWTARRSIHSKNINPDGAIALFDRTVTIFLRFEIERF